MIRQMYQCILLGVAVMLLNAGDNGAAHQDPSISVSLKEMTLVDQIRLTCLTSPHHNLPCSFYGCLTKSTCEINISQSQQCVLDMSGDKLLGSGALQTDGIRTKIHVFCIVTNGTENNNSKKEMIVVWRISLPMSYAVFALGVLGSLIVLSLASLCITCIISISTKGSRKAYRIRSGKALEGKRDNHKLKGYDADSAPEEDEDEKEAKVAEDELCYATVIHPENCARSITFEQRTEYATVVINTPDTNKQQSKQNLDAVDNTDDAGKDEGFDSI